ncbi:MAG: hypothetical protein HY744_24390, partial [Deltaproteobacteria bacterium]|nr:hypothetical protein [Deltaproteobacteria bacterium]
ANDPANCGSCGNACAGGLVCASGACALQCLGGATKCGSKCVDVANDPANCGSCGNACPGGQVCASGACALVCYGGTTKCGSKCVDLNYDPTNCGSCGKACGGGGAYCSSGSCVGGACVPSGGRAGFNTLAVDTASGCWNGNPCSRDNYAWDGNGQNFAAFGQQITCSGSTACVANVGISTYEGSTTVCQGAWNVYCDGQNVGTINTLGKTCTGLATTNGCKVSFSPRQCSQIKIEAASDGDGTAGCCGSPQPDSMIMSVSAW